jgi:hypothetical protein
MSDFWKAVLANIVAGIVVWFILPKIIDMKRP